MKKQSITAITAAAALALAGTASAATWTGGGTDDNWTTGANWGGTAPSGNAGETLVFDGTTRLTPNNDFTAGTAFLDLQFGATAGDFVLGGNSITLGDGGNSSTIYLASAAATTASFTIDMDLSINESVANFSHGSGANRPTTTINGLISANSAPAGSINFLAGSWSLTNSGNSFNQQIGIQNVGTLSTSDLKDSGVASQIGAGSFIKVGNGGGTGTLAYTGAATQTDRQIRVGGGTAANHDGGGTILNNGSGAITFDNAAFNETATGVSAARTLELGGSYAGVAANVISGVISDNDTATGGIINMSISGSKWELQGDSTYTGDTTVASGAELTLADDGSLTFVIGADGVNNGLLGDGTLTLDGDFVFDLTGAGTTVGDSWSIVDIANLGETFGATFTVVGFADAGSGLWIKDNSGTVYEFSETTGALTVIPEPSSMALLGAGLLALVSLRRRIGRLS